MDTITKWVQLFMLFFLSTSAFTFILSDIAVKNNNLSEESVEMASNLQTYQEKESQYSFTDEENQVNYTMTGYETIDSFDKSNVESKGQWTQLLFLNDAISIVPLFMYTMLPFLPLEAFQWIFNLLIAVGGYYFSIAIYNAWKARRT